MLILQTVENKTDYSFFCAVLLMQCLSFLLALNMYNQLFATER